MRDGSSIMRAGRGAKTDRHTGRGISMSKVEWLLSEAADAQTLKMDERNVIDDERWRATIERLQLGPGLRVFLSDVEARQDLSIEARDDRADRWVGSQVTIAGRADIDFLDGAQPRHQFHQRVHRPLWRAAAAVCRSPDSGYRSGKAPVISCDRGRGRRKPLPPPIV